MGFDLSAIQSCFNQNHYNAVGGEWVGVGVVIIRYKANISLAELG